MMGEFQTVICQGQITCTGSLGKHDNNIVIKQQFLIQQEMIYLFYISKNLKTNDGIGRKQLFQRLGFNLSKDC